MERVPTQTDLLRLCDAVHDVAGYYDRRFLPSIGTDTLLREMQRLSHRMKQFHDVLKNIPHPAEFFMEWTQTDKTDCFCLWSGWESIHFDAFLVQINCARVVFRCFPGLLDRDHHQIHACHFGNFGGSQDTRNAVLEWSMAAQRLRTVCQHSFCEEQQDILNALDGVSCTADELQHSCHISRSRLFGKRNDKNSGGLNELVRLGFVSNGTKDGSGIRAYYRPDRPPN